MKILFLILLLPIALLGQIPTDSLVAYYPFNGNANDESGNGNDGTVSGATLTTDRFGNANSAYYFGGDGDYINSSFQIPSDVTDWSVSAWVFSEEDQDQYFLGNRSSNYPYVQLLIDNYAYRAYTSDNSGSYLSYTGPSATMGWTFLTLTRNTNTDSLQLYMDGELVSQQSDTRTGHFDSGNPFYFGRWGSMSTSYYYKGKVDDVTFYNRALSAAEIDSLYHLGDWSPPAAPTGLTGSATGEGEVTLTWSPNSEGDLSYYVVNMSTSYYFVPSPADSVAQVTAPDTTVTITDLPVNDTYYFRIAAVDDEGDKSAYSAKSYVQVQQFTDIQAGLAGISDGDVSWGDYDRDGDLDALVVGGGYVRLYRNDGGDTFTYKGTGILGMLNSSAAWGDYDNDNDLDIFFAGYSGGSGVARLYRNDNGAFTYMTEISDSLLGVYRSEVAWGDCDNDGDLDIALAGYDGSDPQSRIYRNDGDHFTDLQAGIGAAMYGTIEWGDVDNDNDMDLLVAGNNDNYKLPFTSIYRNDGSAFVSMDDNLYDIIYGLARLGDVDNDGDLDAVVTGENLEPDARMHINPGNGKNFSVNWSAIISRFFNSDGGWGDYDNDGDLDLAMSGKTSQTSWYTRLYRNDGATVSEEIYLQPVFLSSLMWGDYNGDGDLDLILSGYEESGDNDHTIIYRNNSGVVNSAPTTPQNVFTSLSEDTVRFGWDPSTDGETASPGLTYNLRVGTTSGGTEIMSPQADLQTGWRYLPGRGNADHDTSWALYDLPEGDYTWSVQAIDPGGASSGFSSEQTFTINWIPPATPTGLTATEYMTQVTLAWDANTEADLSHYRVCQGTTSGFDTTGTTIANVLKPDTTYIPSGLSNWTTYYFVVAAIDSGGNSSPLSNEASATPTPIGPIVISELQLDDDDNNFADDESAGDSDGSLEQGETIRLTIPLTNIGSQGAMSVSAVLRTNHASIALVDSVEDYGTIEDGQTVTTNTGFREAFDFTVDNNASTDSVQFQLYITATAGGPWTESFKLGIVGDGTVGPLMIDELQIDDDDNNFADDESAGDADGIIEAGESIRLTIPITNPGTAPAVTVEGRLRSISPAIVIYDSVEVYETVGDGETQTTNTGFREAFDFDVSATANPQRIPFKLYLTTTSAGGPWTLNFKLPIGFPYDGDAPAAPTNLGATPGGEQISLTWTANAEADLAVYRIYRDTSPNAATLTDSVAGSPPDASFIDTGLTEGQTYYYRITAVDTAGNASGYSNEVSAAPLNALQQDSLALVALYNSTNGASWTNNTNWLSPDSALDTWYGVTVSGGRVTELSLGYNELNGTIPQEIGDLTALTGLYLAHNSIGGPLPSELQNLTNLVDLYLYENPIGGTIPTWIGNLTSLESLYMATCQLTGSLPDTIGNLTSLDLMRFHNNQLEGTIPSAIGNLTALTDLYLSNNQFSGTIPVEIYSLPVLRDLSLGNNQLTGTIPAAIGNMSALRVFHLNDNQLGGSLPIELGNLTDLSSIWLSDNDFADLPDLSQFPSVFRIWIEGNRFTFKDIEPCVGVASDYFTYAPQDSVGVEQDTTVYVGSDLTLEFSVGGTVAWNNYTWAKDGTPLGGAIEGDSTYTIANIDMTDAGSYTCSATNDSLPGLTLYGRPINVTVEYTPFQADSLALVALYNSTNGTGWTNRSGWLSADTALTDWYGVTVSGGRVTQIVMQNNNLVGPIPTEIGDLTNLTSLYLRFNDLTGSIPVEIGHLTNLQTLEISGNQLTGGIPSELQNLTNLTNLSLGSNSLGGSIPSWIGNLTGLTYLGLHSSQLTGPIPAELGNLVNMSWLSLSGNQLSGSLPLELSNMTNLGSLALTNNQLSDTLHSWIFDFSNLWYLGLGGNNISGSIPDEIGNLTSLTRIDLDDTQLSGAVPDTIRTLTGLEDLFLENSQYTRLPDLTPLTNLDRLSVENNQLTFRDIEPNIGLASSYFTYSPQDSVGVEQDTTVFLGSDLDLVFSVGGTAALNTYTWTKDGNLLGNPVRGDSVFTIENINFGTAGSYICLATNDSLPLLTLISRPWRVSVADTTPPRDIAIHPDTLDFGTRPIGLGTPDSLGFFVCNRGTDSTVVLTGLNILGDNANVFSVDPVPPPIPAGDSVEVKVYFAPTAAITYTDSLRIDSNDPDEPQVIVYLSGTGVDTPPDAPANLAATPGEGLITLTWDANGETDFLRYRIHWDSSINPTAVHASRDGAGDTTFTVIGLTDGVEYYFRVTAVDSGSYESGYSNEVSAVFQAATPGIVTAYTSDANTVLLDHFDGSTTASILAFEYPGHASVTPSYVYGTGPDGLDQALTLYPPVDRGLYSSTYLQYPGGELLSQSNGTVECWVFLTSWGIWLVEQGPYYGAGSGWTFGLMINENGNLNAQSWNAFNVTSSTTVPLHTWTHVAATWGSTGTKLYINDELVGSGPGTGAPASGYGGSVLVKGNGYPISGAIDELRISNVQRTEFNVGPKPDITPPEAPTGLIAMAGDRRIGLRWNANTEADLSHYQIYQGDMASFDTTGRMMDRVDAPDSTYILTGLENGVTLYFRITAVDSTGNVSTLSTEVSATPAALPTEGLVAWWPLAGDARDWSERNNHGTVLGGAAPTADRFGIPGQAYAFDGVDDYIHYGDVDILDNATAATISLWVKYSSHSGNFDPFLAKGSMAMDESYAVGAYNGTTPRPNVRVEFGQANAVTSVANTSDQLDDGQWHHVVAILDAGVATLYKDGATAPDLVHETNNAGYIKNDANPLVVAYNERPGDATDANRWFAGMIDDIRIYDRALDLSEIQTLYQEGGLPPYDMFPPGTPVSFNADEGIGQVYLHWTANSEVDLDHYQLYRHTANDPGNADVLAEIAPPQVDYLDTNVVNGTTYWYWISAVDTADNESAWSGAVPAMPRALLQPAGLIATPGDGSVRLEWSANTEPTLSHYLVYQGATSGFDTTGTLAARVYQPSTSSMIYGLTNDITYYFKLVAVEDGGGRSHASDEVHAVPMAAVAGEYLADANTAGLWHFNEPGGDIWYDASGNGNHGMVTGTSVAEGVFGGGRSRTSDGEGIWIPHDPMLNHGANDFTVEIWFKAPGGSGSDNLIGKHDGTTGYALYWAGGGNFAITDGSGLAGHYVAVRVPADLTDDVWHHMAGVREAGTIKLFIDGQLAGSADATVVGSLDTDVEVRLDAWPVTLDEVRISSVARTAEELLQHYERAMPPSAPQDLAADPGDTEVTLSWSANVEGDLSHYLVYQGLTSGFDTTGAQVARIDQPATTVNLTGLENATTYYFSIAAVDIWGMISEISAEVSAEPRAYPTLQAVTNPEVPLGWHEPTVSFAFSHPLDPAKVTTDVVDVKANYTSESNLSFAVSYDDERRELGVTFPSCLTSMDTVTITLSAANITSADGYLIDGDADGVAEGSPEDDIVRIYTIAPYADFDASGSIDFDDLARFAAGWYGKDFTCELGPVTGTVPYLQMTPDGEFNLRDLMTFIRMWDWYSPSAAPLAKVLALSGDLELTTQYADNRLLLGLEASIEPAAVHLQLRYSPDRVQATLDSSGSSYSLQLQRVWPGEGILEIDAALPGTISDEPIVPVRLDIQGRDAVNVAVYMEAVDRSGNFLGSIEELVDVKPIPLEFALHQNYPNPFNPATTLEYDLPVAGDITLTVYDIRGREVIRLVDGYAEAGYYQTVWQGLSASGGVLPSGIYLIRLAAPGYSKTIKSLLLK